MSNETGPPDLPDPGPGAGLGLGLDPGGAVWRWLYWTGFPVLGLAALAVTAWVWSRWGMVLGTVVALGWVLPCPLVHRPALNMVRARDTERRAANRRERNRAWRDRLRWPRGQ